MALPPRFRSPASDPGASGAPGRSPHPPTGLARFAREAGEALLVIAAFTASGLVLAAYLGSVPAPDPDLPSDAAPADADSAPGQPAPRLWLVDGFNVLHAAILGGRDRAEWWTQPRRAELLARVAAFDDPAAEIWVVFDGPRPDAPPDDPETRPRLRQVFAPSADDWLVARVRSADDPARLAVVTRDRKVAGRARHRGAHVVSPGAFLARCGRDA